MPALPPDWYRPTWDVNYRAYDVPPLTAASTRWEDVRNVSFPWSSYPPYNKNITWHTNTTRQIDRSSLAITKNRLLCGISSYANFANNPSQVLRLNPHKPNGVIYTREGRPYEYGIDDLTDSGWSTTIEAQKVDAR